MDLLDQRRKNRSNHENAEDDGLHACLRGICFVEGESDEEARDGAETELRHDVAGHAPVLLEVAVCALIDLEGERHGELGGSCFAGEVDGIVAFGFVELVDFVLDVLSFLTGFPDVEPVFASVILAGVDDFEHVFCGVLVFTAFSGAVGLEVVEEGA